MPLEFTEYRYAKAVYGAQPQLPYGPKIATQSIAIGAANVASSAFDARTEFIVITKVDADCRIEFGEAPVAVAGAGNSRYLKAGNEYAFDVDGLHKLGVINA